MPALGAAPAWTTTSRSGVISCRVGPALGALGFDIGPLLDLARIGLDTWKSVSAYQLQQQALRLQRQGIELQRASALQQLAVLKDQLAPAAASQGASLAPWLLGGLALLLVAGRLR